MLDLGSLLGTDTTSPIDKLVSQYMALERKPVETLQSQRDQLNVRSAMFNDLKSRIDDLKSTAESLFSSTDSPFGAHSVTSSNTNLATVSAAGNASNGSYTLTEIQMAASQRLRSLEKAAGWTAAAGSSFSLNGTLVSVKAGATLIDVKYAINQALYETDKRVTASIIGNTLMLEGRTGAAFGITLADVNGTLLKDLGIAGETTHEEVAPATGSWQAGPDPASWTWTMDLGASKQLNRLSWSVQGTPAAVLQTPTSYSLEYFDGAAWHPLKSVVGNVMPDGLTKDETFAEVTASQVRMMVTATAGGPASPPSIQSASFFRDTAATGTGAEIQAARDGSAKVNGIPAGTFSSNSGITNMVHGLTIGLKSTDSVTFTVSDDTGAAKGRITSFLDKVNSLIDYLKAKSEVKKDDKTGNYSRGPLNGYTLYTDLSSKLISDLQRTVSSALPGKPHRLADIGVTMDADLNFSITEPSKLDSLLATEPEVVVAYFGGADGIAKRFLDRLVPYVVTPVKSDGSTFEPKSFLQREQDSIKNEQSTIDGRINTLNERLVVKENLYRDQFTRLQAAFIEAQQLTEQMNAIFSATSMGYS